MPAMMLRNDFSEEAKKEIDDATCSPEETFWLACSFDPNDAYGGGYQKRYDFKKNALLAAILYRHANALLSSKNNNEPYGSIHIKQQLEELHDSFSLSLLKTQKSVTRFFNQSAGKDDFAALYHCAVALEKPDTLQRLNQIDADQFRKLSREDSNLFPTLFNSIKMGCKR